MRKAVIHIKIIGIFLMVCLGCAKKLERLYNDPDELTSGSMEKLFTEMLNNYRLRPSYWEFRTFVVMHSGIYSQTAGFLNTTGVYQQNPSYIESKWNDFYRPMGSGTGTLALYREMEKIYAQLPLQEQEKAKLFLNAASVYMYDLACQMVDNWGDIPFSEAGSLNAEGLAKMARFDEGSKIYKEAIHQLKELNDYFGSVHPDQGTMNLFAKQDILLRGDLNKWQRYINALRLRLLMRISEVEENFVKTEAGEMLANPVRFPLLSTNPGYDPGQEDILLEPLADYTLNLREALTELNNLSAPWFMLEKLMLPADDPRIPVMFDKYGVISGGSFQQNPTYRGLPVNWPLEQQVLKLGEYAIVDSVTFLMNSHLPGIFISSAEVNYLKAEFYQRWGGGDANQVYQLALQQSIRFYYYLNQLNNAFDQHETEPDAEAIADFLNSPGILLSGTQAEKLEKICSQRWLHYGLLQASLAWADYRRTGYPILEFPVNNHPQAPLPPKRLLYPDNEVTYNVNYVAVRDWDKPYFPVFWQTR